MKSPPLSPFINRLKSAVPYYPFTIPGSILFFFSLFLLGTSLPSGNSYTFILSVLILVTIGGLGITARIQAIGLMKIKTDWDTSAPVYARMSTANHRITTAGYKALPFFRIHFILSGFLQAGRGARLRYHRETTSPDDENFNIPLHFPVSGVFHGIGRLAVKDIFGLARAALPEIMERSIVIRPALITDRDAPRVEAQKGDENKSRMKSSDIERYFMREYIPGDRHRDINWKASSRFSELFTRISPVTQEKTKIITIHFRPYTSMARDSLRSVFYLDQCKSALLYFLRSIKKEHNDYQFDVYVGNDLRELENDEDIENFGTEISSIHFRNPRGEQITDPADLHHSDTFVFTTVYDTGLAAYAANSLPGSQARIYRVAIPSKGKDQPRAPRRSLISGSINPIPEGRGSGWLLRKDPLKSNPGIGASDGIYLEDDPLEVRIV
ncbi:MAG: DUF58 domain-containing protein [Spirochaetales bacterium]|nr:DUF58 domain-containing protein [Spirochaetales bacterium]